MTTLTRQDLNFGQGKRRLESQQPAGILPPVGPNDANVIPSPSPSITSVVADILCEFLEVAIHLILYVREVYPSGIFQKRKKYNVPVQVCSR